MFYAYFDESGDTGLGAGASATFALSCVLINDRDWLSALDQLVAFRKYIHANFHISPRDEIKATWLIHNKGDIRKANVNFNARIAAYKAFMRFQRKSAIFKVFTILIQKDKVTKRPFDVRDYAWQFAIQRLERYGTLHKDNIHVLPDEGHGDFIMKKIRAMRRFNHVPSAFGSGSLQRNAENIIEDPSNRNSRHSFFVQLADLNAYAAFRWVNPSPSFGKEMWEELGSARVLEVNKLRGGPPGIVVWP